MYISIVPPLVVFLIHLFILSIFIISCAYSLFGLFNYSFSKNKKEAGYRKLKVGFTGIVISIGIVVFLVILEHLIPHMSFGISTSTFQWGPL